MIYVKQFVIEVIAQTISVVFCSLFFIFFLGLEIKSAAFMATIINGIGSVFCNLFIFKNK
ncbi:hypothetical protein EFE21_10395 [Lactococcus lactis subsp. lactis]|jgi:hypothetical protein|uniref:Prophage protein n=1 Tax=Lactococcus lactis subsp. lactis TaxID=1360 RepID=A0A1V0P0G6_LACLL|nr:hypothetical protein [Lactococcus lactis subsp. lactis]MCT0068405.1 hypothetical protein [Lactococcus lactis subsp. lactis]